MNFAHPSVLWSIAGLVPLLVLFFLWSWRTRRRLILEFVPQRLQASLTVGLSPHRATVRAVLLIATLASLLAALARPRLGAGAVEVKQRGLDILVGIDTSRSMLAEDAGPGISRLERARLAALDLARLANRDRLGLVAFAGSAFLQCPLTIDDSAFRQSLDALDTGIIPQGGTALGPAIQTALGAFGLERDNVRVLVLFTDGEEHETGALEAAKLAASRDLRIFTVGVGSARGELIRIRDSQGNMSYLKDSQGNVVKSSLNEALLQEIATATGGFYLPLQGPRVMEELFTRGLEPLPRSDIDSRVLQQFHERFQWPLSLALVLLAWEALMPDRRRSHGGIRPLPTQHPTLAGATQHAPGTHGRRPTATPLATALLALTLLGAVLGPVPAAASPASALRQYRAGDYESARQEYERLARSRPDDPRYRFNAGASAYRAGDFAQAVDHFQAATRAHDLGLQRDGFYNLGNAQFRRGEVSQENKERRTAWEEAIRAYQNAIQLDQTDARARENLEFVRRQLEDLKNQQQQQQQQQKDSSSEDKKDQDQDQDQKQDPSQQKNQEKDSQQQQKEDQNQESKEDPASRDQDSKQEQSPKSKDGQKGEKKDQDTKPGDPQSSPEPDSPQQGKDQPQPSPNREDQTGHPQPADAGDQAPEGQMTPRQALRLLDTTRGEEKMVPLEKRRTRVRVLKDW